MAYTPRIQKLLGLQPRSAVTSHVAQGDMYGTRPHIAPGDMHGTRSNVAPGDMRGIFPHPSLPGSLPGHSINPHPVNQFHLGGIITAHDHFYGM